MTTATDRGDRYPSRNVATPAITPRLDPVLHGRPEGSVDPRPGGPLDVDGLKTYEETGVLVMPALLDEARVRELNAEIDALAADEQVRASEQAILEPESETLRSLFEVHAHDSALGALAGDPLIAEVARDLLGSDVYVHQSRINLKPGFRGKEFYWHSDFETWHTEDGMPAMRAVSCSVLLTPNHSWNGPLLTIAGSHRWFVSCVGETPADHHQQSLRRQEIGVPDDESLAELARRGELQEALGPPGTVVFFECNVMHGSNSNITPSPRRNVFLVYNSVDNALEEPFAAPAPRPTHIASRDFTPV